MGYSCHRGFMWERLRHLDFPNCMRYYFALKFKLDTLGSKITSNPAYHSSWSKSGELERFPKSCRLTCREHELNNVLILGSYEIAAFFYWPGVRAMTEIKIFALRTDNKL